MISINLETRTTVDIGTLATGSVLAAMAFGPNETLYGIDAIGDEYTINLLSGALTLVGDQGAISAGITDAVIVQGVPEPSNWVNAAIAMLILAVCGYVRRTRLARCEAQLAVSGLEADVAGTPRGLAKPEMSQGVFIWRRTPRHRPSLGSGSGAAV